MLTSEQIETISLNELLDQNTNWFKEDCDQFELMANYIKRLKNGVIGSLEQKENVFRHNFVPTLLLVISKAYFPIQLRTDSAVILGSLAKGGSDHVKRLLEASTVSFIIDSLKDLSNVPFIEACLRVLRTISLSKLTSLDEFYKDDQTIEILLKASQKSISAQECLGIIITASCLTKSQQELLYKHNIIGCYAPLLFNNIDHIRCVTLDVFTTTCKNNAELGEAIAKACHMGIPLIDQMRRILTDETNIDLRLAAARCLTHIYRCGAISTNERYISRQVLPMLVRCCRFENSFFVCTRRRSVSCETLACLIERDSTLQYLASWNNMCVKVMHQCLNVVEVDPAILDQNERTILLDTLQQSAFNVLAYVASNDEDLRRKVMQEIPNLIERVTNGFYGSTSLQLAACRCLHSMSRSVEQLRTIFMEKPTSRQLIQLMQSDNLELASTAAAVVANLLLEFSPGKSTLIDCGCINVLALLAKSEDVSLRLSGIWALMNLSYKADEKIKSVILAHFTPADVLRSLTEMSNESLEVRRLMGFLRNFLNTKEFSDQLISTYGNSIVQSVIFVLEGDYRAEDKEQALCVLVNLSHSHLGKEFIMTNEDVRSKVLNYMMHVNSKFQVAAACTICNLVSRDEMGSFERQSALREMGVNKLLQQLLITKDVVLFDKVKLALQSLS